MLTNDLKNLEKQMSHRINYITDKNRNIIVCVKDSVTK